jgi:hypothetical protein
MLRHTPMKRLLTVRAWLPHPPQSLIAKGKRDALAWAPTAAPQAVLA